MTNHLAWTQSVPSGWTVKPLRAVSNYVVSNVDKIPIEGEPAVRLCNYSDVYNNEFITPRLDLMACTATEDEIRKFGLAVHDVIITKDSESWDDIGVPALVVETAADLVCGYHLALLRPDATVLSGRFLLRCLQAKVLRLQLELAANGVTRFGLPKSDIGSMRLPVPPLERQLAIADFLDRETARLDGLVAAKRRVLDLLAEKRKAIIATAVTRGLDPKVKLRDSGISWMVDVPYHWQMMRAKWLFAERDERSDDGSETLLSLRIDRGLVPHNDVSPKQTRAEELIGYKRTFPGDIVVNRMRASMGLIAVTPREGIVSPDYAVFVPRPNVNATYYAMLFRTALMGSVFLSESHGMGNGSQGFLRLYSEDFLALWLPYPELEEQVAIADGVAQATLAIDNIRAASERTIAFLKERRAALIAAAVTGQIDVGAVA